MADFVDEWREKWGVSMKRAAFVDKWGEMKCALFVGRV
jgi:hypothetical protein